MTKIESRKTKLIIETAVFLRERGRLRAVVLEAKPWGMQVRLKGTRTAFPISYEAIYHHAAKIAAAQLRAEKSASKKVRHAKA